MYEKYETLIQGLLDKGYGSVDNWYSPAELDCLRKSLRSHYTQDDFHAAGIGKLENFRKVGKVRSDQVYWLDRAAANDCEEQFFARMDEFTQYLNRTCFAGIRDMEFHYAVYEAGSFYKKHVDRFQNDGRRLFSFVSYLTESWQEGDGGELVLYPDDEVVKIEPLPGRVIFFKSDLLHEVLVANAQRFSLTGWMKTF